MQSRRNFLGSCGTGLARRLGYLRGAAPQINFRDLRDHHADERWNGLWLCFSSGAKSVGHRQFSHCRARARKAETSARPRKLATGRYTVILEPEAVVELLFYLAFSLNQRSADEGRSFLSKPGGGTRVGEKLFADNVTLLEELIADTERALLVTPFWYIRMVNPQNVMVTGLTRDGVWLVEKGKVVHPVNNFRFNDSPINLLKNLEATSSSTTAGSMIAPGIRAADFNFTSKSDAV